jgi:hypothetical protein
MVNNTFPGGMLKVYEKVHKILLNIEGFYIPLNRTPTYLQRRYLFRYPVPVQQGGVADYTCFRRKGGDVPKKTVYLGTAQV